MNSITTYNSTFWTEMTDALAEIISGGNGVTGGIIGTVGGVGGVGTSVGAGGTGVTGGDDGTGGGVGTGAGGGNLMNTYASSNYNYCYRYDHSSNNY
jgi:hypothetical protein